jgi:CheY-like chemotaxis protein
VPRILVADDNSNIQKMVVLALEERGVDVVAVGNGEAAVRRLPDVNPDLVLADVFMPVRNGYEVCEFIKKDTRYAHIPVILLVGAFDPLDEKEARRVGADGVLKKPFVPPDPLIAMVMSVLEKNPLIAAELAKHREIIAEPPPPEALEAPLRSEALPLPEFPEPTPEEAAAIYGTGKGLRALAGDDSDEEAEIEEKHTRKSKSSKVPAVKAKEPEQDDEFDHIATASEWRRSAADFEVPENIAQDARDSFGSDLDSGAFPSEKDVPPRHIRPSEESGEQETSANDWNRIAESANEPSEAQSHSAAEPSEAGFAEESMVEEAPQTSHAMWLPDSTPEQVSAPPSVAKKETRDEPEPMAGPEPIPTNAARHTEWMDMMAPPPSEYPNGGWMSNLGAPSQQLSASHPGTEAKQAENRSEASSDSRSGISEPVGHAEQTSEQETEHGHGSRFDSQDHFFADAPEPARPSYRFPSESRGAEISTKDTAASVASIPSNFGHQLMVAPPDAERRHERASNRPDPEPLLVDEERSKPSDYLPNPEESSPAKHFFPVPAEEQNVQSDSDLEHLDPSVFEPAPREHGIEEFSERIPTLPPPNREALSGIPFLMPPPVQVDATPSEPTAETVDALVQKVLEKLRPQLQDLFSQGVKPLVENLVHTELSKKDR